MDSSNIFNCVNSWIIYTKSNCIYCQKVKELLEKEEKITIINCDNLLKSNERKETFFNSIKNNIGCIYRTFPIVFLNNNFIGGYTETLRLFDNKNKEFVINEDF